MRHDTALTVDLAAEGERLRQSLQPRPNADVAKGVLMVLRGCDGTTAFAELLRVAEGEDLLLGDLAAALVHLVQAEPTADVEPEALAVAQREWGPALEQAMSATEVHHHALPRAAQHLTEAAEYLTDLLDPRWLVSLGMGLRPGARFGPNARPA